jgi:hypothetical protein
MQSSTTGPNQDIDKLIQEREKTHGSFYENAIIAQNLKFSMRDHPHWEEMMAVERQSLEAIADKISRIIASPRFFAEHWNDIAGYAKLAATLGAQDDTYYGGTYD